MKYIALLRGINVGGNRKVEMKKLKSLFESLGFENISTYINSGNVIFESSKKQNLIQKEIEAGIEKEFGFAVAILLKTEKEMQNIATAIPADWQNDKEYKADVAYLFPEIDSRKIMADLPFRREYLDVRYVKGALLWHLDRKNYNHSHLNKIIGHRLYQLVTVRNVNTARRLANR